MEDWDRVSAADFMGRVTVELDSLADQAIVKGWYPLQDKDGSAAQGEVYLVLQWRRNEAMAFEPFEDQTRRRNVESQTNLRIAAVCSGACRRGQELAISRWFLGPVPDVRSGRIVAQALQDEAQKKSPWTPCGTSSSRGASRPARSR